jgi:hypothetical protein
MGGISHYMGRIFLSIEIFFRTLPSDIVYPFGFWFGNVVLVLLKLVGL